MSASSGSAIGNTLQLLGMTDGKPALRRDVRRPPVLAKNVARREVASEYKVRRTQDSALFMERMVTRCQSGSLCLVLKRAIFIPAKINSAIFSSLSVAGPIVATILVFLRSIGENSSPVMFVFVIACYYGGQYHLIQVVKSFRVELLSE